jgi:hypothetical protein
MVALTVVAISVSLVVRFALGGRPVVANGGLVGGIPILTVVAAVLTLSVPIIAGLVSSAMLATGIRKVATQPPPLPEAGADLETDADRLWRVFASGTFVEYALAEGAVLACAILFHFTADWLMMAFIAGMILYMVTRFPRAERVVAWFRQAQEQLSTLRQSPLT